MVRLTEERVKARAKISDLGQIRQFNLCGSSLDDITIVNRMLSVELLVLSVNNISSLAPLESCMKLRELYLRKNDIRDVTEIDCLKSLPALEVLWIDDNPFCEKLGANYRYVVLRVLPKLMKLDNKDVTNEDRKRANSLTEPSFMFDLRTKGSTPDPETCIETPKKEMDQTTGDQVISATKCKPDRLNGATKGNGQYDTPAKIKYGSGGNNQEPQRALDTSSASARSAAQASCLTEEKVIARARNTDISGIRKFNFCGGDISDVSIIKDMRCIEVLALSANNISSLAPFAACKHLRELYLRKNDINDISELDYLQNLQKLEILWIEQNPFCEKCGPNYRYMVLRALPNLQKLDNKHVTNAERQKAKNLNESLMKPSCASSSARERAQESRIDTDTVEREVNKTGSSISSIAEDQQLNTSIDVTDENKEKAKKRLTEKSLSYKNDVSPNKPEEEQEYDTDRRCVASARNTNNSPEERRISPGKYDDNFVEQEREIEANRRCTASVRRNTNNAYDEKVISPIKFGVNQTESEREFEDDRRCAASARNTNNYTQERVQADVQRSTKYGVSYVEYERDYGADQRRCVASDKRMHCIAEERLISPQCTSQGLHYASIDEMNNNRENEIHLSKSYTIIRNDASRFYYDAGGEAMADQRPMHRNRSEAENDGWKISNRQRTNGLRNSAAAHHLEGCPVHSRRPVCRKANLLSAALGLVNELDVCGLEVLEQVLHRRMDELGEK